jgi:protein gp37
MALQSSIEWTEATWNPVTGCSKISLGCKHCYAERMSMRLKAMGHRHYRNGFTVTLHEDSLELPLTWKRPQAIFVNSMSDLYHRDVPLSFLKKVFVTMHKAHWHRYQILTKRAERLAELSDKLPWAPNIWQGVTVEHPDYSDRIDLLRETGAHIKFLSLEPLLGPMPKLKLRGIRDQCQKAGVAFHFKQWGGVFKKRKGRLLEGRTWDEMPAVPIELLASRPATGRVQLRLE